VGPNPVGWLKLDHVLLTHPKVWAAPEAFGLYCAGIIHADIHNSDGFIPEHAIENLLPRLPKVQVLRAKLVSVGLWIEAENGIEIHNYLKFNRSASEKEAIKQKRAVAGAIGGSKPKANPQANRKQVAYTDISKPADSVQPEKNRVEEEKNKTLKASPFPAETGSVHFEEFWAEYPAQPNGTKPDKKKAHDQWVKLSAEQKLRAFASLPNYRRHLTQLERSAKYAERYLRDRTFGDFQSAPLELVNGKPAPQPIDWAQVQRESREASERLAAP
jgi:hypothetical protein